MRIADFPSAEDDYFEFKGSETTPSELEKKLQRAVSGFANSGGGVFVVGTDGSGAPDGGIEQRVGRTFIRDWIDQCVHRVEPTPRYSVHILTESEGRGIIHDGRAVIAVEIPSSLHGPHMTPEGKYFIRAGAHTVPARHFIVESIWARRQVTQPRLVHLAHIEPLTSQDDFLTIELIAVTESPAINVSIDLSPRPTTKGSHLSYPISVPLIDKNHSFDFRFMTSRLGETFNFTVGFSDIANNTFQYDFKVNSQDCISPYDKARDPLREIAHSLSRIEQQRSRGATFS